MRSKRKRVTKPGVGAASAVSAGVRPFPPLPPARQRNRTRPLEYKTTPALYTRLFFLRFCFPFRSYSITKWRIWQRWRLGNQSGLKKRLPVFEHFRFRWFKHRETSSSIAPRLGWARPRCKQRLSSPRPGPAGLPLALRGT